MKFKKTELATHYVCKGAEMKLKSTTTNGFNLRIINSLMHNAFLGGGGGYASPALTVN